MVGRTVSRYRVLELLGSGGNGKPSTRPAPGWAARLPSSREAADPTRSDPLLPGRAPPAERRAMIGRSHVGARRLGTKQMAEPVLTP